MSGPGNIVKTLLVTSMWDVKGDAKKDCKESREGLKFFNLSHRKVRASLHRAGDAAHLGCGRAEAWGSAFMRPTCGVRQLPASEFGSNH